MKKIIVFPFLLISVVSFAQNEVLSDTMVKPVITELGKPDGEKVEMKIGKDGGSLKSSDGKVELIFSAGALKENTNIVIQPVTNLAPNGSGKAYWFEPSGIQFKKPVQIIFNYTDEEAETCPPDLMGLAIQDKQGQWSFVNYDSWDSAARLLTGSINHFSGATNVNKLMLIPPYARVKVNSDFAFKVVNISPYFKSGNENPNTFYHNPPIGSDIIKTILWYVNDIEGGDSHNGNIVRGILIGRGNYTAPNSVPNINPVTLKAELYLPKKSKEGKTLKLAKTLRSKILIYDYAYEVKIESKQQGANYSYLDNGSFVVALDGKNSRLIETRNNNSTDKLEFDADGCTSILINPRANHGHIHITGVKEIKVTPAVSPNFPLVEITFIPAPMVYSTFKITCMVQGKIVTNTTEKANAIVAKSSALPLNIKFLAKEGEQVIENRAFPGGYYKVTVKQLRDD